MEDSFLLEKKIENFKWGNCTKKMQGKEEKVTFNRIRKVYIWEYVRL